MSSSWSVREVAIPEPSSWQELCRKRKAVIHPRLARTLRCEPFFVSSSFGTAHINLKIEPQRLVMLSEAKHRAVCLRPLGSNPLASQCQPAHVLPRKLLRKIALN